MSRVPLNVLRLDLPLDAATFDAIVAASPTTCLQVRTARGDDAAVWQALQQAHVYHVSSAKDELPRHWFVGERLIQRCPNLLAVSTYGAGYDTVDLAACTAAGIGVMNQAGSNAGAVAEHAFGLMLGLSKRIAECDRRLRRGDRFARHDALGFDLDGRTLGLVGMGHVGSRMAALGQAFGMRVLASDPLLPDAEITRRGAEAACLAHLLAQADVVSLHCPLDASTAGLFGAAAFTAMKAGALFITTARGGIHDEAALHDALRSGHLAGAGLDVWSSEPPPADHPLLVLPNVFASYHIAGVTRDARTRMASMAANQIVGFSQGVRPPGWVNAEAWANCERRLGRVLGWHDAHRANW